ncbi:MAG: ribosome assembly RNA-binding protein YhbY [Betaproteobacteria bacterium]|nr:ribosome assembly RNA-binding protein YhbY [Betaproteobacteria bacterium]
MNAPRSTSPSRTRPAAAQPSVPELTIARAALVITSAQRRALRADAHHLDPVVMIGDSGLTEAVVAEADRALNSHELIKIRVLGDDREVRALIMKELCSALGCASVQMIGKLLVIWRPAPPAPKSDVFVPKKEAARRAAAPAKKPGSTANRRSSPAKTPAKPTRPASARTAAKPAGARGGVKGDARRDARGDAKGGTKWGAKPGRVSASKTGAKSIRGDRPNDRARAADGTGFGGSRSASGRASGVRTSGPRADRTESRPPPRPTSGSRPPRPAAGKAPSRRAPPRKR